MTRRAWFNFSLAAKCRLLFGLAVALIIATALFFPWYYMERLVDEMNLQEARRLVWTARSYLQPEQPDWQQQQELLNRWWAANAEVMHLSPIVPTLVRIASDEEYGTPARPAATQAADAHNDPFIARAIETFRKESDLVEHYAIDEAPDGHSLYRLATAVRAPLPRRPRPVLVGLIAVTVPSDESDAQVWVYRIVIVAAGALAGFLAILVFYLITHKLILSPIHGLKAVAEQVGAGDLGVRADVKTGDEFEDLANAVNDMLAKLQKSREELETINRSLDARLEELAQANVALFEANKVKGEFLANVTHELRTPLTSIIGFAELLRDASRDPEHVNPARIVRFAHNILTSGRNLLELINDLLDLAKMEAGKLKLHRTHFALRDTCEAVIDFCRPLVEKKELRFEAHLADDLPTMHSDAGRIQQILYNLLSNAIKFTPSSGTVRLDVHRLGEDKIRIVVADTGPGIPAAQHSVIFEKFRQLDSSMTREHAGTGLGLPISRELTQMLGGTISLESEAGHGTTFTVILPVECPETARIPLVRLT